MRTVTDFPRAIEEIEDAGITMSDGIRLSARIWKPVDAMADPVPAVLEFLPYRKRDGTTRRDQLTHPWLAGHGYAGVRVDMRGTGDSEGLPEDEYSDREWADAVAVIEWLAAQPWCNGNVGMMGISWGGFNSLQLAALRPPALKAIITLCSTVDRYADDIHFKGGCLLNENLGWGANMLSYMARPPDRALVGERWREMWLDRLRAIPFFQGIWLSHQARDDYWRRGSVCEDYAGIEAAVLTISGWHDGYRNTTAHLVASLDAPVKGIVGPWIHKYPHYAGPEPAIGFLQEAKRWWDRWLKGAANGVEDDPAMRMWLMDSIRPAPWHPERPGRWIAEAQWPSPDIAVQRLHLTPDGLSDAPAPLDLTVDSPQHCGMAAGEYFPFMFGPELPRDQRADDELSVCFDGAPADAPIDIVGAPEIALTLSADQPQANICVRLCDVHPDGASELISYGLLNLTQRASRENPQPVPPHEPFRARIVLDQCAYRLPAGHRLRVAISNSYWPMIWPSPRRTALTLTAGELSLPLRPLAEGDEWQFEQPEGAAPWRTAEIRPASSRRDLDREAEGGAVRFTVENDFGEIEDLEHGLVNGSRMREVWSIHPEDPLSASAEITWEQTGGRGDWRWRSVVTSRMGSTADSFSLSAELRAYEGDELVHERNFDTEIARQCL